MKIQTQPLRSKVDGVTITLSELVSLLRQAGVPVGDAAQFEMSGLIDSQCSSQLKLNWYGPDEDEGTLSISWVKTKDEFKRSGLGRGGKVVGGYACH